MSRMKSIFLVLLLTAIVGIVPLAQAATTVEVNIAGSSALWQTLSLGAFSEAGAGAGHWTSASNVISLTDSRVTPVNVDPGTIWVVWNAAATEVWTFIKVDSVVGNRCYFAQPQCSVSATLANLSGSGSQQISSTLWGADSALPSNVVSLFTTGITITVAATDIRPEDAAFAICRVNSQLGFGSFAGGTPPSDGLDGLGYNTNIAAGACPGVFGQAGGLPSQSDYVGETIDSAYPVKPSAPANVLSFNISGKDPISGTAIPKFTVVEVGAEPVVFIAERETALAGLTNATPQQLQQVFSGQWCDAGAFELPTGTPGTYVQGGINVFLREPLSGTYNTTEATVMRHPTIYPPGGAVTSGILGVSMETGVNTQDPLSGTSTCNSSNNKGARYRAIGTSEEVKSVLNSSSVFPNGQDGIGFTFFSYGNVGSIANNPNYGYITLNNIDPIFASYGPQTSTGAGFDPGQPVLLNGSGVPVPGVLPGAANLPCNGGAFPCPESEIWAGGLSFPNLRNGSYPAWSLLRVVATGTPLKAVETLIKDSQAFVVTSVPDYVPAVEVKVTGYATDPGLQLVRSHYQQYDGADTFLGAAPVDCGKTEAGGDMGGVIIPFVSGKCSATSPTQEVQSNQGLQVRP